MFNSQILEIAIGLVFVYLVASLLASVVRELVESVLKTRAVHLERGIRLLLDDPSGRRTTAALFAHPQLFGLFDGVYEPERLTRHWRWWKRSETLHGRRLDVTHALRLRFMTTLPSYIPSRNFALALLDLVARRDAGTGAPPMGVEAPLMETLLANANALTPGRVRDALLVALQEARGDFDRARTSLEAWFDSGMDRVSGWYKRESQAILLVIGLVTAALFNIDTLHVTHALATNNAVRAQVVFQAEATRQAIAARAPALPAASGASGASDVDMPERQLLDPKALADARRGLGDLIGWKQESTGGWSLQEDQTPLRAGLGWLLTALAISLGAPFWFDLLNKMMVVRATVKPFEKSPPEGSEDRSGGTPPAERLEPARAMPATPSPVASASGTAVGGIDGAPRGRLRLAVDTSGVRGLMLTVDGEPVPVPVNGLVEVSLVLGTDHALAVTGRDAQGTTLTWSRTVRLTRDDDGQALEARPVVASADRSSDAPPGDDASAGAATVTAPRGES